MVNKFNKNFQKKVLHLRFGFAIITFARLKGARNLGNKPFPKKFQKTLKKLLTKIPQRDILNELRQSRATTKHLDK